MRRFLQIYCGSTGTVIPETVPRHLWADTLPPFGSLSLYRTPSRAFATTAMCRKSSSTGDSNRRSSANTTAAERSATGNDQLSSRNRRVLDRVVNPCLKGRGSNRRSRAASTIEKAQEDTSFLSNVTTSAATKISLARMGERRASPQPVGLTGKRGTSHPSKSKAGQPEAGKHSERLSGRNRRKNTTDFASVATPQPTEQKMMGFTNLRTIRKERTPAQLITERATLSKLLMVAATLNPAFVSEPDDRLSVRQYLKRVDDGVLPLAESTRAPLSAASRSHDDCSSDSEKATMDACQRLLVERNANHWVHIHTQQLKQLMPPPSIGYTPTAANGALPPLSAPVGNRKKGKQRVPSTRRRSFRARSQGTHSVDPPPAPLSLTPLQRIEALQAWRTEAVAYARDSVERNIIPVDAHVSTRVLLQSPCKFDVPIMQGYGVKKSADEILQLCSQPCEKRAEESGQLPPVDALDLAALAKSFEVGSQEGDKKSMETYMVMPCAIKPLVTVYCSSIPRRERLLGSCTEVPTFDPTTTAEMNDREVPAMPRYATRITVLIEYNDLDPDDLLAARVVNVALQKVASKEKLQYQRGIPRVCMLFSDCHL